MARLRTPLQRLRRLLEETPWPVYAVDDAGRIVFGNAAFESWTGTPREELLQQHAGFGIPAASGTVAALAAALAPPPSIRAGGAVAPFPVVLPGKTPRTALGIGLPLADGALPTGVLVVVVSDDVAGQLGETTGLSPTEASELHAILQQTLGADRSRYPACLVGRSAVIARVRRQVASLERGTSHLLVTGPPGIGRESVVRHIDFRRRSAEEGEASEPPFAVACPVMDAELLQAALEAFAGQFGAHGVTSLLLMEVDRLPREAWATLTQFLDSIAPNLDRLAIYTTARAPLTADSSFPTDLAHRLATWHIDLPRLADRREDVPLIAQQLLEQMVAEFPTDACLVEGFHESALDALVEYDWPENVAELSEVVASAVAAADGPLIEYAALPPIMAVAADAETTPATEPVSIELDTFLEQMERELIGRALKASKGNKAEAARRLGISRARLIRRAKEWDLA